jgi:Dynamin family
MTEERAPDPDGQTGHTSTVLTLIDRAARELRLADRDDLTSWISHERRRMTTPVCNVLVVGEFKKGKSALVNALLNARVCAADPDLATAVPTVIRHGDHLEVTVVTSEQAEALDDAVTNGSDAVSGSSVPLAQLARFTTDTPGERIIDGIDSVVVKVPRQLLADGLVVIDTPGVNGGLAAAHAAATLRALAGADAVILVTDASQELSEPELEFFRRTVTMCPTTVCVMTKIDFYPHWRQILDLDRGHLQRAGLDVAIIPLAAPLRHRALRTGDRALDEESGFPRLSAYLRNEVIGRKEVLATRVTAAAAREALQQVTSRVAAEHAILSDPAGVGGMRERLEVAKQEATRLRSAAADWQQLLADRFGDLASNVDTDLTLRLRTLRDQATERIEASDPSSGWPEFQAWLHQRTNEEVTDHFTNMRDMAEAVAAEVLSRFDESTGQLTLGVDLLPETLAKEYDLKEGNFERLSKGQLAFVAVRGSAGSMIIASMVGTFAGALGTFAAVVGTAVVPGAAVLALFLGGKSIFGAKDAQVRANRAEATRNVRRYLEEVELVTRKDSRATMRRVNQRLRNYLRVRAAELERSASQNLEATARAIKSDNVSRQRQLEKTTAELRRLRPLLAALDHVARTGRAPSPDDEPSAATTGGGGA